MTPEHIRLAEIEALAKEEIRQEQFREAIERRKAELRKQSWWKRLLHRLFPFIITIARRNP